MARLEYIHMKKYLNELRSNGALTHRIPDYSVCAGLSLKRPFDAFVHFRHNGTAYCCPMEFKFQDGGQTFNIQQWQTGKQGHQYLHLIKYAMLGDNCLPFLVVLWKVSGRIQPKHIAISECMPLYVVLEECPTISNLLALKEHLFPGEHISL